MRAAPRPDGRQAGRGTISGRRVRQLDQRELARRLQERAARDVCPTNDDGPLPRID